MYMLQVKFKSRLFLIEPRLNFNNLGPVVRMPVCPNPGLNFYQKLSLG